MSKLADSRICPDCRAPLDPAATCTGCGLRLVGPLAAELYERMLQADRLIDQLRTAPVTAPVPPPGPQVPAPGGPVPAATQFPAPPPAPPRARPVLPSASVPVVLLSLGALCLLVAAIVFVAVAWSSLGLAAKTTILLAVTALFVGAAAAVTRRELRFAAETLWLVVSGLVAIDLTSAYSADLLGLGRLSDRDAIALVGATLLGVAVGVGAWATTTALRRVHCLVAVAGLGIVLLAGAEAWTSDHNPLAVAVSVPLLTALAVAIDRVTDGHLRATAAVVGSSALVSWLVLVGYGVDRMSTTTTVRAWWVDLEGWPLIAAALLAALPALAPSAGNRLGLPDWVRMLAAGGALVTLALFVAGPGSTATADLLTWAAVTGLLAAVCAVAPRVWAWPAAALTALGLFTWSAWTLGRPLAVITRLPGFAPERGAHTGLTLPHPVEGPAAWTAVVATLVVGATAAALLRHLPSPGTRDPAGRAWIALGPGVLALGATTWLVETQPTLLVALLAWSATVAVAAAMALTARHHDAPLAASLVFLAYLVAAGMRLAAPSHPLAASFATVLALVLATGYARAGAGLLRGALLPLLAGSTVLLAGLAATHWPYVAHGHANAAALSLVALAAVALAVARPLGRGAPSRITIEATGLLAGLVATTFADDTSTVAMVLTVLGTGVAVVTILNQDREDAAWIGVALLGVATIIRVVDDVRAPELYTLPAAAILLAAGWWRLDHDPRMGSMRVLGSGLTLALVPSVLLALDDPVSLRGVLVAVGGVVTLAIGVLRLWAAPFVAGALTTGVLAVRHLGPVVEGLPRWISLGSLGLLLLLVGVTWERRRRDVEVASRYLASLS